LKREGSNTRGGPAAGRGCQSNTSPGGGGGGGGDVRKSSAVKPGGRGGISESPRNWRQRQYLKLWKWGTRRVTQKGKEKATNCLIAGGEVDVMLKDGKRGAAEVEKERKTPGRESKNAP